MSAFIFSTGLLVVIALLATTITILFFNKKDHKFPLLIILFSSFILRLVPSTDSLIHEWDERFHALVAKNMLAHSFKPTLYDNPVLEYDYKSWVDNHIWLHKQPIPLWIISSSLKLFGISALSVRIPSIILSTLSVLLTYYISLFLFEKKSVALFSAFLQGINGFLIENAAGRIPTDHIDSHFLFFIELSIFLICLHQKTKKKGVIILIGIALGMAIMTKWLTALFILPLFFILNFPQNSIQSVAFKMLTIILFAAIVSVPWQVYTFNTFPLEARWEQQFNFAHIGKALEGHSESWFYHLSKARIIWNELIYIPLIWLVVVLLKERKPEIMFLFLWISIPYVLFSIVKTKMPGYVIICAPAIFMTSALFFDSLNLKMKKLGQALLFIFVLLGVRYAIERIKPFQYDKNEEIVFQKIERLGKQIKSKNTVVLNFPFPTEAMFYHDCIAYSILPPIEEINNLKKKGYDVIIYQP
ncbi:ArnT family glycosyltransferase [Haliscomenobacter sp.]|uniref:ArnT family glycosyltransferase n=1 Tax=Haliscomenobacter sp. TaxID=2717303 RepID=UPI003593B5A3